MTRWFNVPCISISEGSVTFSDSGSDVKIPNDGGMVDPVFSPSSSELNCSGSDKLLEF